MTDIRHENGTQQLAVIGIPVACSLWLHMLSGAPLANMFPHAQETPPLPAPFLSCPLWPHSPQEAVVIGGMDATAQAKQLAARPHVVIATPGRLSDLLTADTSLATGFSRTRCLVMDEADRLLDPSFGPELGVVLGALPRGGRQTLLFSATLTPSLVKLQQSGLEDAFVFQVRGCGVWGAGVGGGGGGRGWQASSDAPICVPSYSVSPCACHLLSVHPILPTFFLNPAPCLSFPSSLHSSCPRRMRVCRPPTS
jgi:hypothetical protein